MTDTGTRPDDAVTAATAEAPVAVTFREAAQVWAKIGLLGFGGPAGQIALMHRILVDEKRWISDTRFLHALNFCMLLPGPEAQQLATYVGWLLHGMKGGLVAGTLFIVPGFLVILGLSFIYVTAGSLPLVEGVFIGLKSAVIAIVLQALIRIGRRSLKSAWLYGLAGLAFIAMFALRIPFPYVIVAAAAAGFLAARRRTVTTADTELPADKGRPALQSRSWLILLVFGGLWLAPVAILLGVNGPDHVYSGIAVFFSKMAVVTFGGAYAVLAYVAQEAVQVYGWLAPGEMIDGLALAETTPGPLILVVQFVGFLAAYRDPGTLSPGIAGLLGSMLTVWVTFAPCFLWIFLGAPHIEPLRRNRLLAGALSAVTAAVVGVIANLAAWFSIHAMFTDVAMLRLGNLTVEVPELHSLQYPVLVITVLSLLLVFRARASIPVTLLFASALGIVVPFFS